MVIRIRFKRGPRVRRDRSANRRAASAVAALLTPASLMACVLALWRVGADMAWTGSFAIHTGLLSHWQVWLLLSIGLQVIGMALNRYGNSEEQFQETEEQAPVHEPASKVSVR